MTQLRIVALDLSLTATGIAATHDSKLQPRLFCRTVTPPRSPRGEAPTLIDHGRIHKVFTAVRNTVLCKPDLVVIEWLPQFQGHGDASLRLAELHGTVKHWLWSQKIRYVDVMPAHLQMYATGKGRASKQEVRGAVTARYGRMLHVGTEDEADATALLMSALDAYGQPLVAVPEGNRKALAGTAWPQLDPPTPADRRDSVSGAPRGTSLTGVRP